MKPISQPGAIFMTTGTLTGATISSTVGGMGIVGRFGGLGIGEASVTAAGAVIGAAAYGAFEGMRTGDTVAFGAMGIGAMSGFGISNMISNMGFVAPKVGLAFGIGTVPMAGIGAVLGLAAYGVAKLLNDSECQETPMQLFERMEEKILQNDYYNDHYLAALLELSGDDLNGKFTDLEIDDELEKLKAKINSETAKNEPQKILTMASQIMGNWQCVKTLKGHTARVNSVAIHPDNKTLVSGSNDRQVNLWNLQTGKCLYIFSGQREAVLSVAISPDGKQVISGTIDRKISSWELETKKYHRTFSYLTSPYSHNGFVNALVYSPNGHIIASASGDKTIRIWQSSTGTIKRTLNGHTDAVLAIAINPDSTILVSGSADQTIRIWNLQTGENRYIINQHLAAVNTLAITPDNQTFISGSTDSTIKLWHLHTGELYRTVKIHSTAISAIAIHPDGKIVASSSQEGIIKLWNLQTGALLATISGFSPLVFSLDGTMLISGDQGGTIKIWQLDSGDNLPLIGEWWEILGVEPKTHPKDVKVAYLRLARLYHPDINSSVIAKTAMQAVNQAYQKFQQQLKTHKTHN
jgi:WD40 repeat protein